MQGIKYNDEDFLNKKFGKLTIVKEIEKRIIKCGDKTRKARYVEILCDCGNSKNVRLESIMNGSTIGCGCYAYKRTEDRSVSYFMRYAKNSAKKRKINFELSKQDVAKLIYKNCYYCCSEPENFPKCLSKSSKYLKKAKPFNGLDRVNPNLGYTLDNVVTCCELCNKMKLDLTSDEFKVQIVLLYHTFAKRIMGEINE